MSETHDSGRSTFYFKLSVFLLVVVITGAGLYFFRDTFTLDNLARRESLLREYKSQYPVAVFLVGFLLYVVVTGLSLPFAAPLTLAYGWYFGVVPGLVVVSFASTLGATITFLLSRYLFRDYVKQNYGKRLQAFEDNLERDGAFYLFTLRLVPAVPFFVINIVMGMTPIRLFTFWWVSQLGMLAGTLVYVYTGASFPSLDKLAEQGASGILKPQLIIGLIALGLFPLVARKIVDRIRGNEPGKTDRSSPTA